MNLKKILSQVKTEFEIIDNSNLLESLNISDIAIDSRLIQKENSAIFFALNGKVQNGADFVPSAIEKGARVVVCEQSFNYENVISVKTKNVFDLLVEVLKIFYTPLPTNIYAVTGTNGKTSTAEFTRQILEKLGKKSASIGTIGINCDEAIKPLLSRFDLTTPDIVSLYKNLKILKENFVDDVAIETSSIGLEQKRIAGLDIQVGAFTNFSQDHLDYHKSMDEYFACKMLLFSEVLASGSNAVINADIKEFDAIKKICTEKKLQVFDYGFKAKTFRILEIKPSDINQIITFEYNHKKYDIHLSVSGEFQAYNLLCALLMVFAKHQIVEEKLQNFLDKLSDLKSADGRMQQVAMLKNGARVFIDFAHTPDALENVLKLARKLTKSKLLVLFGCGGNRDNKKRPLMGKIASDLADIIIVTDDNPRNERPQAIRHEILTACDAKKTIEIDDRKEAIKKALEMLGQGDILVLAGKGHEKYQIIGTQKFEFDEEKITKELIKSL